MSAIYWQRPREIASFFLLAVQLSTVFKSPMTYPEIVHTAGDNVTKA